VLQRKEFLEWIDLEPFKEKESDRMGAVEAPGSFSQGVEPINGF
jgi:hypothetical protein